MLTRTKKTISILIAKIADVQSKVKMQFWGEIIAKKIVLTAKFKKKYFAYLKKKHSTKL